MAWEKQVSGRQGPASGACACWFLGLAGRRTQFELASLKRRGGQEESRPGSWIMDVRLGLAHAREMFLGGRTKRPSHIVLLAQNPCRHVCCAGAHRRELKEPSGKLIEGDAAWGNLIDGTRNLIDWLCEVPVVHLDDGLPCLLDQIGRAHV